LLARLDEEPRSDLRKRRKPSSWWRRAWALGLPLVAAAVAVAIVIGALALLRGAPKPTQASHQADAGDKPDERPRRHLVDILGVLRRPQTPADRAFPAQLSGVQGAIVAGHAGTPVIRLARLATITSWGQKVFIEPVTPLTAVRATALEHRYPFPCATPSAAFRASAEPMDICDESCPAAQLTARREASLVPVPSRKEVFADRAASPGRTTIWGRDPN
jgi:hypothetical protein